MVKQFVFVRHAESLHNAAYHAAGDDPSVFRKKELEDAPLTQKGKEQAGALAARLSLEIGSEITAIWSSPLTRCIETANEIFEEFNIEDDYYLHDNLMERQGNGYYFNKRKEKEKFAELNPHVKTDHLSELPAYWGNHENDYSLRSRMWMMVQFLRNLYKEESLPVVIVGHSDAIQTLTGKHLKNGEYMILTEAEVATL